MSKPRLAAIIDNGLVVGICKTHLKDDELCEYGAFVAIRNFVMLGFGSISRSPQHLTMPNILYGLQYSVRSRKRTQMQGE